METNNNKNTEQRNEMRSVVYPFSSVYAQVYYDNENHISRIELHNQNGTYNNAFIRDSVRFVDHIKA